MPKLIDRLNAEFVTLATQPGRYHDGAGLYLVVTDGGKSWLYRYTLRGRTREMGLGSVAAFPIAAARKRAKTPIDPVAAYWLGLVHNYCHRPRGWPIENRAEMVRALLGRRTFGRVGAIW